MEDRTLENWLQTAVEQMRFRRDRDAVRKELWEHMMDRRLDFLEQGMEWKDAEEAVLKAMGDPVKTGTMLNQVHSPLLGWLWICSKWLFVISIFAVFTVMLLNSDPVTHWKRHAGVVFGWKEPCSCVEQFDNFSGFDPLLIDTGMRLRESCYTMTLDHGFYYINPIEDGGEQYLTLAFKIRGDHVWDVFPDALKRDLQAVDDLGDSYVLRGSSLYQVDVADIGLPVWTVHVRLFIPYDGPLQQREWFRFFVPDTEFAFKIYTNGEVSAWG